MPFGLITHVTVLLIVAFFILFAASKAEGLVTALGRILAAWLFVLAILHIVGFFVPGMLGAKGFGPGVMHSEIMHGHWMHWGQQPAPAATPAPVPPVTPIPKKP
ncbi:MAG: hypothetical protein ACLQUZ_13020 [Rhizomicrobium sp.]